MIKQYSRILILQFVTLIAGATLVYATQGVTSTEIRFGIHTDKSGPASIWGIPTINSLNMHFEEVNRAGGIYGRKIRLIAEDHQYQVPRAVQAVNKLLNRDKVFAMVGALGTPMNNAVMKSQLAKNVPNLFPYSGARSMVEPLHRLKFSSLSTYYDQMRIAIKYFIEKKGKKRICLMYQDTDYGQEVLVAVTDQLKAMNKKLVAKTAHKPTATNFVSHIVKLKKSRCDLVVLGSIVRDTIIPLGTAKKMGWKVDFIGTIASYDQIVIDKAQGATAGYYAMTSLTLSYKDTVKGKAKIFFERYEEKYGKPPGTAAQVGYTIANLVTEALQRAGRNLTVNSLVKALESIRSYPDIFGGPNFSLSSTNHKAVTQSLLAQIQGKRWVTLTGPLSY